MLSILPIALCLYGLFFTFQPFWKSLDAISGDLGDARFNIMVLEHTWLWVKGVPAHHSLFNMPMYYPHPNTYAYSDSLFSIAPLYWLLRWMGLDLYLSFQFWIVICSILNFTIYYLFAKKLISCSTLYSSLGAYIFSFALPRITHLGHAQLVAQFFSVISAAGLMMLWKSPRSKIAPYLFVGGAIAQFASSFYFFWFWVWTLAVYGIYICLKPDRRKTFKAFICALRKDHFFFATGIGLLVAFPFLLHYASASREFGRRSWSLITALLPRVYSWIALPPDHWEWPLVPFKKAITELPFTNEHYLSFGLLTWIGMLAVLVFTYRNKSTRYLAIPIIAMFFFTFCIGKISPWVFPAHLLPAGRSIRAVGRIQIYMLLFWSTALVSALHTFNFKNKRRSTLLLGCFILIFFAENTYTPSFHFSRHEEIERIASLTAKLDPSCKFLYVPEGFAHSLQHPEFADHANLDAMVVAFTHGISTINGYSGQQPAEYQNIFIHDETSPIAAKLASWAQVHSWPYRSEETCLLNLNQ